MQLVHEPRALGEESALYAVSFESGTRAYLMVWRQGPIISSVLVTADQTLVGVDLKAIELLERVCALQEARIRSRIGEPVIRSTTPNGTPTPSPSASPTN